MQVEHIDFAPALGLITGKVTQPNRSPMGGITVGAPMGGITVRAEDRAGAIRAEQTTTGANGSYRIWLEPGTYLLAVENPEGAEPVEVIARAGEEMGNVDFAPVGATIPTWPFTTALAILGVGVLACLMPLVRRGERLGGVLLSPDRVFQEVTGQPDWVGPFFLILVSVLVGSIAMTGKLLTEMGGTLGGMPGAVGMMMIGMPLFVLAAMLVGGYAGWFIRAGSIWIIARLSGERSLFYPLLSVVGYAFLPELLLGGIVMACVVSFGEISISSMSSLIASTSLAGVLPALAGSSPMRALLGEIELFAIWSVVLTTVGVRRVYGVSIRKAGWLSSSTGSWEWGLSSDLPRSQISSNR